MSSHTIAIVPTCYGPSFGASHMTTNAVKHSELQGQDGKINHETQLFSPVDVYLGLANLLACDFPGGAAIYSMGCSTGEEPLSMLMTVLDRFGEAGAQRYPITAMDISQKAMHRFQHQTVIPLSEREVTCAQRCLQNTPLSRYLTPDATGKKVTLKRNQKPESPYRYTAAFEALVNAHITKNAGDHCEIRHAVDRLFPPGGQQDPCIVFFSNAWHYLPDAERARLIDTLYDRLPSGSVIVVGRLENSTKPVYALSNGQPTISLFQRQLGRFEAIRPLETQLGDKQYFYRRM